MEFTEVEAEVQNHVHPETAVYLQKQFEKENVCQETEQKKFIDFQLTFLSMIMQYSNKSLKLKVT